MFTDPVTNEFVSKEVHDTCTRMSWSRSREVSLAVCWSGRLLIVRRSLAPTDVQRKACSHTPTAFVLLLCDGRGHRVTADEDNDAAGKVS